MENTGRIKRSFYERYAKRILDIFIASVALVISSPFLLICMIIIKLDDPHGNIFFRQERNGRNGKVFKVIKFRTMKRELCGKCIEPTADTLTGIGRIIRKLSVDEFPQFVNVLKGEMGLIGPRPLPVYFYEWFTETELCRFRVRPGLTGLSQINGRANLNWDERFALDVQYVESLSFRQDMKIFFRTFSVLLSHKDVIPDENNVLENFDVYRKRQLQNKIQSAPLPQPVKVPVPLRKTGSAK